MSREGLTYLITGATRGIGRALATQLLSVPKTTVIAAIRKIDDDNGKALQALPKGSGSRIILVKLDSTIENDAREAVDTLTKAHHIEHIDVVIANAGINNSLPSAYETTLDNIRRMLEVNTFAPLTLFRATRSLLKASSSSPKFVIISSIAASLEMIKTSPFSNLGYSISKASANVLGLRLAAEESDIITLLLSPGVVGTDMVAEFMEKYPELGPVLESVNVVTADDSSANIIKVVEEAKKEDSGRFVDVLTGENLPW